MREIKFRGKIALPHDWESRDEEDKAWWKDEMGYGDGWVKGYLIGKDVIVGEIVDWDEEGFNTEFWYKVDPSTVGEYTGLQDVNDKEICEGDIGKFSIFCDVTGGETLCTGVVVWDEGMFGVLCPGESDSYLLVWVLKQDDCFEVIGNTHDNPELLHAT